MSDSILESIIRETLSVPTPTTVGGWDIVWVEEGNK